MIREIFMKYKYLFFCCIIMILSISAVSGADNVTQDILADDSAGDLSDLQNSVDEDNTNYIRLTNDYFWDSNNETVVINKSIAIDGKGHTIDYYSNKPLFDIQAPNVIFSNEEIVRHNMFMAGDAVYTYYTPTFSIGVDSIVGSRIPTVFANDITKIYKNDTQYYARFVDEANRPLKNTTVTFHIHGVSYDRVTDSDGVAKLNINLKPGNYILRVRNPVTYEGHENMINVDSPIIMHYFNKHYGEKTPFKAKYLGSDGNPVGAGETVTFYINGVYYNRTTDSEGVAALNINLLPGAYGITTVYNGYTGYTEIDVYSPKEEYYNFIEVYDLVKTYGDETPFTAKIYDEYGHPASGEIVKFKINGVEYDRITDSNGIAKLNINLMPGRYIISISSYTGDQSNLVTVEPAFSL